MFKQKYVNVFETNIKKMASVKALLYKSKTKADGRYPIAIRIIIDRKVKYLCLNWIHEKDWDDGKKEVKSSHPNSMRLNNVILKKMTEANDLILESESLKKDYTAAQIYKMLKGNRKMMTFFQLANDFILDLRKAGKHTRAISDGARINQLKNFFDNNIRFHEIDEPLLKKLKVYLLSNRQVSERTVMNYFVVIRTLFNIAISEGIVDRKYYPFGKGKIQIKFGETIKIGLDEDEIIKIEKLDLKKGTPIWHARNVFLFSFYLAGVRISDVLRMKWDDIKDERLYYTMSKNKKVLSLKLPEKVISMLNYYVDIEGDDENYTGPNYIFPELKKAKPNDTKDIHRKIRTANKKFNNYFSQIAKLAKINKRITCHIARHTFGNIAGDQVSPKMLQKLYRHTSLRTTVGYQGNFIHKNADEALDTVVNF